MEHNINNKQGEINMLFVDYDEEYEMFGIFDDENGKCLQQFYTEEEANEKLEEMLKKY
jgi:hypothetical protein